MAQIMTHGFCLSRTRHWGERRRAVYWLAAFQLFLSFAPPFVPVFEGSVRDQNLTLFSCDCGCKNILSCCKICTPPSLMSKEVPDHYSLSGCIYYSWSSWTPKYRYDNLPSNSYASNIKVIDTLCIKITCIQSNYCHISCINSFDEMIVVIS